MRSRSCCLCGESTIDDATVRIGDEIAHGFCADATDVYDVLCCPYCRRYEMIGATAGWAACPDGIACPECAADFKPERNPRIDALESVLVELHEEGVR